MIEYKLVQPTNAPTCHMKEWVPNATTLHNNGNAHASWHARHSTRIVNTTGGRVIICLASASSIVGPSPSGNIFPTPARFCAAQGCRPAQSHHCCSAPRSSRLRLCVKDGRLREASHRRTTSRLGAVGSSRCRRRVAGSRIVVAGSAWCRRLVGIGQSYGRAAAVAVVAMVKHESV